MSGNTIGGLLGATIGFIVGGPAGLRWGFTIGSMLGGIVDPEKIYGPRLQDAARQTSQEGIPIPFGYGSFPCAGNVIWASVLTEHKNEEGGKGGPKQITYSYTRSYAIGVCEGEAFIQKIKRNGKLVYDISPGSTIQGKSAKFLRRCTIYTGDETQTVDPTIEADVGVGNSGPMRGLCYIVMEDDDVTDSQGAIPQYEFVVQKCGAISYPADTRVTFVAVASTADVYRSTRLGVWSSVDPPGTLTPDRISTVHGRAFAFDNDTNTFFHSDDDGATWSQAATGTVSGTLRNIAAASDRRAVAVVSLTGSNPTSTVTWITEDGGVNWHVHATSILSATAICHGNGVFVIVCDSNGNGVWTSADGATWTQRNATPEALNVFFNGLNFLCVGDHGETWSADSTGVLWTYGSSPGGANYSFRALCGHSGYFVAAANAGYGLFRTTDLGVTWNAIAGTTTGNTSGSTDCAASGGGVDVIKYGGSLVKFSFDGGVSFASMPPAYTDLRSIDYVRPGPGWYVVPDADGLYADENGNLITDYTDNPQVSECSVTVGEIVADLCDRAGVEATEYDVSELTDTVAGYKCATEASAQAFIEPLMSGFFFDRGEWDKKLRFPKRGHASVAALTPDDLVANEEALIGWERVQEVELLRKVNILTIDPATEYNAGKQSAERRVGTIQARAEATVEIPIVCDVDTAARIADKRLRVAWAETAKARYALPQEFSYLTPTDVVTLTDRAGTVHRVRLVSIGEEQGVWSVDEAMKDRASTYTSQATGVPNPNDPGDPDTVTGPTLFVPMNLPQLRSQDNTPGVYVGACGILSGWNGCAILLSLDGGVSYFTALTITTPTILGNLTADASSGGSPDTLAVHVFGTLSSKTTAQVDAGGNYSAITPNTEPTYVATTTDNEVVAYEDATETAAGYYTLGTLSRGLLDTTAEAHASGDWFVDLSTIYFVPISADYAGATLYFKAVSFGLSADSVDPVSLLFEPTEYVLDGGGA